jgi:hypothetical protein
MERARTTIAVLIALLLVSVVFTCCTMSGDNGVDTEDDHVRIAKWVTIDGDDYDPNTDCYAPLIDNGASIQYVYVDSNGTINAMVNIGHTVFVRRVGNDWVDIKGTPLDKIMESTEYDILKHQSPPFLNCHADQLKIDSNGYPHILSQYLLLNGESYYSRGYVKSNGSDLLYMKWNGTDWVNIYGEKIYNNNITISRLHVGDGNGYCEVCRMQLDSEDRPHIYWERKRDIEKDTMDKSYYIHWDGDKWLTASGAEYQDNRNDSLVISGKINYGVNVELFLGIDDSPHIFMVLEKYYEEGEGKAKNIYYTDELPVCYLHYENGAWRDIDGNIFKHSCTSNPIIYETRLFYGDYCSFYKSDSDKPFILWTDQIYRPFKLGLVQGLDNDWVTLKSELWNKDVENHILDIYKGKTNVLLYDYFKPIIREDNRENIHIAWCKITSDTNYDELLSIHYLRYNGVDWLDFEGRKINLDKNIDGAVISEKDVTWNDDNGHHTLDVKDFHLYIDKENKPHLIWLFSDLNKCRYNNTHNYIKGIPVE